MFDLQEIQGLSTAPLEDGIPMKHKHPVTGKETGAVIMVRSYNSDAYKAVEREQRAKTYAAVREGEFDPSVIEQDSRDRVLALVSGWDGVVEQGQKVDFTEDRLKAVLDAPFFGDALSKQIDEFAKNTAAFFKASTEA